MNDCEARFSNGWSVKIARGFDIYQRLDDWLHVWENDLDLSQYLETNMNISKRNFDK